MNYQKVAQQLLEKLGGKDNIAAAAHCATRLRLALHDDNLADLSAIESIEGVKGQFQVSGQLQIIFGSGIVNNVYAEFSKLTGQSEMSSKDVAAAGAEKQNWLQRAVKGLSDILFPLFPPLSPVVC
jgi:PTS system sucrose-specific IIB component, Glc family (TC 4.A.1.2.12)/PTS system sucrose-specific IIC component, Glc family (TC 4.A.1.2.12)